MALLARVLVALAVAAVFAAPAQAASVTVTSTGDASTGDGACTLREAITAANSNAPVFAGAGECVAGEDGPVRDTIVFSLGAGVHTIAPATALPVITDPLEIDGRAGSAVESAIRIEIDGNAVSSGDGLLATTGSDGSYFHNLAVFGFPEDGIRLFSDQNEVAWALIGMNQEGLVADGNGDNGITIEGERSEITHSAISGNGEYGIELKPRSGVAGAENTIRSSRIGTNKAGTAAVPNAGDGIHVGFSTFVADGDDLTIGGPVDPTPGGACDGDCNLISGNGGDGIEVRVSGAEAERTDRLAIEGNFVGTDLGGGSAVPNTSLGGGIRIFGATQGAAISGNVIAGNSNDGIQLIAGGPGGIGAADTAIAGNTIGLGSDGSTVVANGKHGIYIDRSLLNGPALTGTIVEDNVVAGNAQSGIVLFNTDAAGGPILDTEISGNRIGTDSSGSLDRGNQGFGLQLVGVSEVTVGRPGAGNVISDNGATGILLSSAGTTGNTIQSNLIGVAADGVSPLGNAKHGLEVNYGGAHLNTIGGTAAGTGNVIAHNGEAGIAMIDGVDPPVDNPILGNAIFLNAALGIDMRVAPLVGGVTENGACEEATGANRCQEFPVLTAAAGEGGGVAVAGTLASDPNRSYRVELFASAAADPSGNGEGERLLGAVTTATDGSGGAGFLFAATTASLDAGEFVSATATELGIGGEPLSTSEFSDALAGPVCDLEGGGGIDELNGGVPAEVICGFGGGDTISGGAGRDAVLGGEGDDTIDVADGEADVLVDCGPGNDTVSADAEATDAAAIFVGCETINRPAPPAEPAPSLAGAPIATAPAKVYKCKGKRATIVGSSKKETIKGTGKADVIVALGGNDTVKGRGGNDTICGGSGNDRLFGEKGNDRLDGGAAKDTLKGGPGNDRLKGASGKPDLCDGGPGKKDKLDGKKAGCEQRPRIP